MHKPRLVLCCSLALLSLHGHIPSLTAESPSDIGRASRLHPLPLLFEETPAGPATHARGLRAALDRHGAVLEVGGQTLRLDFIGSGDAVVQTEAPLPTRVHRLRGQRSHWRTNIPTFGRVRLAALYPGIDAVFYGNDRQLEYDMEVAAGADPAQIVVAFRGADGLRVDGEGQLRIAFGDRAIVQRAPYAYQDRDGTREPVAARYTISGDEVRFALGAYDRSRPLVIDPIISYSTYFGADGNDSLSAVAMDGAGNVLVAGTSEAGELPVPSGRPRPPAANQWANDTFVAKLAPDGTPLWLTILGGSDRDHAADVASGPGDDVFVAGTTYSSDFPVTAGAFDPTANMSGDDNQPDVFVARLSSDGADLRYSTYLGGAAPDFANSLAVDGAGRAHVGGLTYSTDFPATAGGPPRVSEELSDGFVTRLSANGSTVEMSRLIAGNGTDVVRDLALDAVGEINVTGYTTSDVFPVVNAMRATSYEGDCNRVDRLQCFDGFVMRLTTAGELRFSTYLGGTAHDQPLAIGLGPDGSLYIAGETTSDGFPGTSGRRPDYDSGFLDIFLVRMADNGMRMLGGRYFGGTGREAAYDLAVDRFGLVWITGYSWARGFPEAGGMPSSPRGGSDIFAAQFSADLWDVHLSGRLGGSGEDVGSGLTLDGGGNAWIVGYTDSTNYPVVNPIQPARKGTTKRYDAVITKLDCEVTSAGYTPHRTVPAAGSTGTITIAMDPGCTLNPASTVDWLRVTEIGADRIHYRVDPNPGATSRTGWIMVEPDWGHRVTQLGTASPQYGNPTEIVLGPEDATAVHGSWYFDTDPSDTEFLLRQTDRGRPKVTRPEITPQHYFEMAFYAEAGRPYRLWVLGIAQPPHWSSDSVHVQFSGSVDASGNPIYRIGTRSSAEVNLEDCPNCGVPSGMSWEDNGWGSAGALGPPIRFASTGWHTLWVQTREDGMAVGQILLSAERYFTGPPPEGEWIDAPGRQDEEIVLHARDAATIAGSWQFATDSTASRNERLWHPDAGASKVTTPAAAPRHFVEFTFDAVAGRPYKLWVRLKAERDSWRNDSIWVQFSDSVDASGAPVARIGSGDGLDVNLEECSGCGIDGWGWRDEGWGASPAPRGQPVYFATTGTHTLRIQTREDGVSFDQIVISADAHLQGPPGAARGDDTIFE